MDEFRLQKVLDVKLKFMETKEEELLRQRNAFDETVYAITETGRLIDEHYQNGFASVIDGSDFAVLRDYIAFLEGKRNGLIEMKIEIEGKIIVLQTELVEILKEVKVLENLKKKVMAGLRKAENRKLQKRIDSLALRGRTNNTK